MIWPKYLRCVTNDRNNWTTKKMDMWNTFPKWLFLGQKFPEQHGKAVDIIFDSSFLIDVLPDFRRCVCHSSSTSTATIRMCLWVRFPLGKTKVTYLLHKSAYIWELLVTRILHSLVKIHYQLDTQWVFGLKCKDICDVQLHQSHFNTISTPCLKKTVNNYLYQNFVKFPPSVKFFCTKMAYRTSLSEVHWFSTSPNLCQRTTLLNADVPYCYITL